MIPLRHSNHIPTVPLLYHTPAIPHGLTASYDVASSVYLALVRGQHRSGVEYSKRSRGGGDVRVCHALAGRDADGRGVLRGPSGLARSVRARPARPLRLAMNEAHITGFGIVARSALRLCNDSNDT